MNLHVPRCIFLSTISCLLIASTGSADSLFSMRVATNGTLISDNNVRFDIGDIITVLVRESIDARTRTLTDTEKKSSVKATAAAAANSFLVGEQGAGNNILSPGGLPNWNVDVENTHEADGETRRRSTLTMTVSCTVTRITGNGNLVLEGTKRVTVNREDSEIYVQGVARPADISAANTILSNQLANSNIGLKGRGPLWNNQRRGLISRFLDWFSLH